MIIDCISDLHGFHPKLEGGDLLIIAGDLTECDCKYEEFFKWLSIQDYKRKIFISGNHDNQSMSQFDWGKDVDYLCDSGTEFEGFKIWGSPWTKTFKGMNPHCKAFTCDTEKQLAEKWALIPKDVDILITHSPPHGILDECPNGHVGSTALYSLLYKELIKLKLHVFGHVHEGYGHITTMLDTPNTQFVNASHVEENYIPINNPIRIIL